MPRPLVVPSDLLAPLAPEQAVVPAAGLTIELELKAITPVLGGGVRPFTPDTVDIVRGPSVRGQLRWWWRRLFRGPKDTPADLFRKEAALWGGVGKGVAEDRKVGALKSRVSLAIDVIAPGATQRVGVYPVDPATQRPGSRIEWEGHDRFAYALFPLQRDDDERNAPGVSGSMPLKSARTGLRFRLTLELRGVTVRGKELPLAASDARQVLAALWCWLHLGGYGARTRRGFGALEIEKLSRLAGEHPDITGSWSHLFDPASTTDPAARLRAALALSGVALDGWCSQLVLSPPMETARSTHEGAIELLKTFRQGRDVGRDLPSGNNRSPVGRSRWPEPNLLRLLREEAGGRWNWEHEPPSELRGRQAEMGAPRAAFGLPIVVHFKDGQERRRDGQANGEILPAQGERWASPLLLRPVRWPDGQYRTMVFVLRERVPEELLVKLKGDESRAGRTHAITRSKSLGSRDPIHSLLTTHSADALAAFCAWLQAPERRYSHA